MDVALLIPDGDTLVTYYLLPLLGLNKTSFGRSFKSSYLNKAGSKLFVELGVNMKVPIYKGNINYLTEVSVKNKLFVIFSIPEYMVGDTQLFIAGRYSEFSRDAKKVIFKTSSLPYNKTMGSFKMSNPILQALDRTKTLRLHLERTLGIEALKDSAELIDKPEESWFIENIIT